MSTATATEAAAIPAGKYRLDPVHSTVGFEVKHMISTFRGSFRAYDAVLESTNGGARLEGSAEVASVGNLKPVWAEPNTRDWAGAEGQSPAFREAAVQVKTVWLPYGA